MDDPFVFPLCHFDPVDDIQAISIGHKTRYRFLDSVHIIRMHIAI